MRQAILDGAGRVLNVIVAPEGWPAPPGCTIRPATDADRVDAAPEPTSRILTVLQFRDRLTPEEEIVITSAGMSSPAIRVWLDRLAGAVEVNLDDPRTLAGLQSMEAAGLLGPGRAAEIAA